MRISITLPSVVCVSLLGCASGDLLWRYDNPTVRELQQAETDRLIHDDGVRAAMMKHMGERVSLVRKAPAKKVTDSSAGIASGGRAAALTSDGYFLTAYHVVQDWPFYIEKTEIIQKPPTAGFKSRDLSKFVSTKRYSGRLVWFDHDLDLAILKFPVMNWPHFTDLNAPPKRGDIVVTSDDEGRLFLPADEQGSTSMENAIGNGAFFAAGEVWDRAKQDRQSRSIEFSTTLVARGGMSGSPLMTVDYELCGIVSRAEGLRPFQPLRTIAAMIEPDLLFEIIASDRQEFGSNNPMQETPGGAPDE